MDDERCVNSTGRAVVSDNSHYLDTLAALTRALEASGYNAAPDEAQGEYKLEAAHCECGAAATDIKDNAPGHSSWRPVSPNNPDRETIS